MDITEHDALLILRPDLRDPELERRRLNTLARSERLTPLVTPENLQSGIPLPDRPKKGAQAVSARLAQLSPHAARWGDFDCGDARITNKLAREALRADAGLQTLYGVLDDQQVVLGAMTLRAGVLAAPNSVLYDLGQGELDVPSVHLEVLAVHAVQQGRGYGRDLIELARALSVQVSERVGVRTLSVEATPGSRAFYTRLGFQVAQQPWPDGTWPMWLLLK